MTQISAKLENGTTVQISNGRHEWHADEPANVGGSDSGPNPYELLLGSLAACTCITISLYCRHKELPLKSVSANYELDKVHADDCDDCDNLDKGYIDQISSNVHIEGDFTEAQQKRLAQIVERCPVHKTLAHGVQIADKVSFVAAA